MTGGSLYWDLVAAVPRKASFGITLCIAEQMYACYTISSSTEVAFTKSKVNLVQLLCNEANTKLKIEPNACKPSNYHVRFVPLRSSPTAETAVEVAHLRFKKPAPLPGPVEGMFPL